jgi:hypothetical protein
MQIFRPGFELGISECEIGWPQCDMRYGTAGGDTQQDRTSIQSTPWSLHVRRMERKIRADGPVEGNAVQI